MFVSLRAAIKMGKRQSHFKIGVSEHGVHANKGYSLDLYATNLFEK
jgi:hypothetical protein